MPEPVAEYFRMGGYAFYVWSSYAVVLVVLALNLVVPSIRLRRVRRALAHQARSAESPDPGHDAPLDADGPSGRLAVAGAASGIPAATARPDGPRDGTPP